MARKTSRLAFRIAEPARLSAHDRLMARLRHEERMNRLTGILLCVPAVMLVGFLAYGAYAFLTDPAAQYALAYLRNAR